MLICTPGVAPVGIVIVTFHPDVLLPCTAFVVHSYSTMSVAADEWAVAGRLQGTPPARTATEMTARIDKTTPRCDRGAQGGRGSAGFGSRRVQIGTSTPMLSSGLLKP
ncbi:hypothetical protein Acor_14340 [Acrocarpospora corrugata]|uniref:Uncharacterized protein n=1 Tax=Acrocarpospora corrugata TaxID=35763 RepID=A0A5M3VX62_9ACTN|nr:hypothetical protein Acor_14340 [Acrocarpospora corrugata]